MSKVKYFVEPLQMYKTKIARQRLLNMINID